MWYVVILKQSVAVNKSGSFVGLPKFVKSLNNVWKTFPSVIFLVNIFYCLVKIQTEENKLFSLSVQQKINKKYKKKTVLARKMQKMLKKQNFHLNTNEMWWIHPKAIIVINSKKCLEYFSSKSYFRTHFSRCK